MGVLYVDESKVKGYSLVAAVVELADAATVRRRVRQLVLPGQRRIHFAKESDSRRRAFLARLVDLGVESHVFHSSNPRETAARAACLAAVVAHAAEFAHTGIVIERDQSIEQLDQRTLFRETRRRGLDGRFRYGFETPHAEPLLWIADAIAWSYTRSSGWRRRADSLIAGVMSVDP